MLDQMRSCDIAFELKLEVKVCGWSVDLVRSPLSCVVLDGAGVPCWCDLVLQHEVFG